MWFRDPVTRGKTLDSLLNCTSLKFCEPRSFILEPIECDTSIKKYQNSSKLGTDEECTMTNKNKLLSNFDAFYYTKTKCNKKGKRTFMSNKLLNATTNSVPLTGCSVWQFISKIGRSVAWQLWLISHLFFAFYFLTSCL